MAGEISIEDVKRHLAQVIEVAAAVRPCGLRLAVVRLPAAAMTAGGLLLPSATREPPAVATVAAVAESVTECKPGAIVAFPQLAGTPFCFGGVECLLLEEADVLAILGESAVPADLRDALAEVSLR